MSTTPMMKQYLEIKEKYKNHLLMFRLGDFYELFYQDAEIGSKDLEITLTGKDCGENERAPMCGIPYHSAEGYINKLVEKGHKVAVCEQLEERSAAKGIVKRDVVRIITPGTILDTGYLDASVNSYLCGICVEDNGGALAFTDIFDGIINVYEYEGANALEKMLNEIGAYAPKEVILNISKNGIPSISEFLENKLGALINDNETELFDYDKSLAAISGKFSYFTDNASSRLIKAAGAVISYLKETQKREDINIVDIMRFDDAFFMEMDITAKKNLELFESLSSRDKKGSLLWVLDKTKTSQGARTLRKWIDKPLLNCKMIMKRQNTVMELTTNFLEREQVAEKLSQIHDIERIVTKVLYNNANPRDIKKLGSSIGRLPELKEILHGLTGDYIRELNCGIENLEDIYELIENAVNDEPPLNTRDGGIIKDGYNEEVDYLRSVMRDGKGWISRIEQTERELTGIKNIKIGYNKIFGYYIEVTKSNIAQVPERYIRKQTLSNCERYVTEEVKDMENSILNASEKVINLESELFEEICSVIAKNAHRFQKTAASIGILDALYSLSEAAVKNSYTCPEVDYSDVIEIKEGRHPVIERMSSETYFIPNDADMNTGNDRLYIITGPNMAGKSTYMRQVAIITLMAQIGSFVPAGSARIGIVDKIFTRIGASDDLFGGQSTFMVEMNEVSYILKNATKRSLIIYDEIGRGTSTFDGMSIARAVLEYTAGKKIGAKTLFATHYHELTELENMIEGVKNYNIAAKKKGDDIIFLRKIVRGAADDSYGIEVAKLAGISNDIIKRAKEILAELESGNGRTNETVNIRKDDALNISFDDYKKEEIYDKLSKLNLNILTPIEAFSTLFELKKLTEK